MLQARDCRYVVMVYLYPLISCKAVVGLEAGTGQSLVPVVWAADHLVVAMCWLWVVSPLPVAVLNL